MHIAVLAPLRFPIREPFAGGVEMHTYLLVRELQARGHEVRLFALPNTAADLPLQPVAARDGAGVAAITWPYYRALRAIRAGNFDAVHDNGVHFLPSLLAGTLRCPVVTTLHTPPYLSLRLAGRLARRVANHHFASISHYLHGVWAPYVGPHAVVHNGLDLDRWPYRATPDPGTAVWYGRFTAEKGAEYAIEAALAAGRRLTLAGPIYDEAYFRAKVAPRLGERVRYAGHLGQSALARLVGRSEVGLVTSVWDEPFGLAYAEMLACGTPVAAFASGAVAEILTGACGAIVPKYDTAALTQVLGEVSGKERGACRRRVETHFPVSKMVDGYERLYAR